MYVTTPHMKTETDPVPQTLCSLEYLTMNRVQKRSNPGSKFVLGSNLGIDSAYSKNYRGFLNTLQPIAGVVPRSGIQPLSSKLFRI
jgi:hypothetical protein